MGIAPSCLPGAHRHLGNVPGLQVLPGPQATLAHPQLLPCSLPILFWLACFFCRYFERGSRYVAQASLELTISGLCLLSAGSHGWPALLGWPRGRLTFHSSSSLLICWAVICRARSCSCSDGILTSQDRKQRSWISGCHCELSQLMSLRLLWLAQGCLHKPVGRGAGGQESPRQDCLPP